MRLADLVAKISTKPRLLGETMDRFPGGSECETSPPNDCGTPMRETAKYVLLRVAKRLRDKAHAIECLAEQIGCLSPDADQALWEMAQKEMG